MLMMLCDVRPAGSLNPSSLGRTAAPAVGSNVRRPEKEFKNNPADAHDARLLCP